MSTFTGKHSGTITIVGTSTSSSAGVYQNPLTIMAGSDVYGTAPDGAGVKSQYAGATLTNHGSVYGGGSTGNGVDFTAAGTINNYAVIAGGYSTNRALDGTGGAGVVIDAAGGVVHNFAGGRISGGNYGVGGIGVLLTGAGTITNAGTIEGYNGYSGAGGAGVDMTGGTITNEPDTSRIAGGNATLGHGGDGVDLRGGAQLTNSSAIFGGQGYGPGPGSTGGNGVFVDGGTLTNLSGGNIEGGAGLARATPGVGVLLNGGTVTNFALIAGGYISYHVYSDAVRFTAGTDGTLVLNNGSYLFGAINGFAPGDTIDVSGRVTEKNIAGSTTYDLSTPSGELFFSQTFVNEHFVQTSLANGVTEITLVADAACYVPGTRIRTPSGERAIETLSIGDLVSTGSGAALAIRWIGRRTYSKEMAAGNRDLLPVAIGAGALGGGLPSRPLKVSPDHAMLIDGMLIAARDLTNGTTIRQEDTTDPVRYLHIEFDEHELIYAEGALSESFADDESRQKFDNADEYAALYPHQTTVPQRLKAPRVDAGWELEAVRERLSGKARAVAA